MLLEECSSHFLYGSLPDPGPPKRAQAGLGLALCLHTCGAYQASVASQGFAMSLVFWSPQWIWSYRRVRGPPRFSLTAVHVTTPFMPRVKAQQILLSERGMGEGLEQKQAEDISGFLPLREHSHKLAGRQGDVCRNRTHETGRWPNSFRWALEQAPLTEPAEMLSLKPSDVFPETKRKASRSQHWSNQAWEALSWQRVPQRRLWVLREQATGTFLGNHPPRIN